MITTTFTPSISNACINQNPAGGTGLLTTPFNYCNNGTNISFRARGSLVRLLSVNDTTGAVYLSVNGGALYLMPAGSHNETVWSGADQWTTIEIQCVGPLFLGPADFIEVTGAAPAMEIDPAIGRWLLPSTALAVLTTVPGTSGHVGALSKCHSLIAKATELFVRYTINPGFAAYTEGWTNNQPGENSTVAVSLAWGDFKRFTLGGNPALALEHFFRTFPDATIQDVILRGGNAASDAPTTDFGAGVVVTGTSLTLGHPVGLYKDWPNRVMNAVNGRLKVINLGIGASQLYNCNDEVTQEAANRWNSFKIKDQIIANLLQFSIPILVVSHLCNDAGQLNEFGAAKTPAEFQAKLVQLVEEIIASVPLLATVGRVFICDIETTYQSSFRAAWSPALVAAVADLNAAHAGMAIHVPTDDLVGGVPFYTTVTLEDGIHEDTAGNQQVADHHAPYFVSFLAGPSASTGAFLLFFQ